MIDSVPQGNINGVPLEVRPEVSRDNTGITTVVFVGEPEAAVEVVVSPEVVAEEPIVFQSSRTIEELINDGPEDGTVEEKVRLDIHKLREHIFDANVQLVNIVEIASSHYLREFLR